MRSVFQNVRQWRLLRSGASSTAVAILLFTAMIVGGPTAAKAQGGKAPAGKALGHYHHHIRGDQAEVIADAGPTAKAHFTCELRPFDLSKGLFCYGPAAIRSAYGLNGLLIAGFNGTGRTIVILDAFGSPTAFSDLQAFDKLFGVPDPPSFNVITMPGTPPFDPTNNNQLGWAEEVSLDVQWSHAIAPGANIILVAAASNSDVDLIAGLNYAIDNHLGDVVSMSFGQTELGLTDPAGRQILNAWDLAFQHARDNHVTLFVSSGDNGSDTGFIGVQNVGFPASSKRVTAVGGTNLFFGSATNADPNGTYQGEKVWNDGFGAGGGGVSLVFPTPEYQEGLAALDLPPLQEERGVPDVAYNAGVVGGVIVHLGFLPQFPSGAFFIFGGTSAGAPQWSGIIADINQVVGHPVGFLNNRLYKLGRHGKLPFHDVTIGGNGFNGVTGFTAGPGYDLATGWGTPNLGNILAALLGDMEEE
jgi:subtilase family serine protease